ncbi:MAG: DUF6763 family protein [Gammaproteobacteria bacterium]
MEPGESAEPEIGVWYLDMTGRVFEVVALDSRDDSIEIQHFDGTVEELDYQSWEEILARIVVPPGDWSGAMDVSGEDSPGERDTDPGRDGGELLSRFER